MNTFNQKTQKSQSRSLEREEIVKIPQATNEAVQKPLMEYNKPNINNQKKAVEIKQWITEKINALTRKYGIVGGNVRSSFYSNLKQYLKRKHNITGKKAIEMWNDAAERYMKQSANPEVKVLTGEQNPITQLEKEKNKLDKEKEDCLNFIKETNSTLNSAHITKRLFNIIDKYHLRALETITEGELGIDYNAMLNLDNRISELISEIESYDSVSFDEIIPLLQEFTHSFFIYRDNLIIILSTIPGFEGVTDDMQEDDKK